MHIRVEGIPNRANSQKEILHLSPAVSATIMLATEPNIVKLPAIVLTKASKHQNNSGLLNDGTECEANKTKGTFESKLEPTNVTPEKIQICLDKSPDISSKDHFAIAAASPLVCKPPITTNKEEKNINSDQSSFAKISPGSFYGR